MFVGYVYCCWLPLANPLIWNPLEVLPAEADATFRIFKGEEEVLPRG